MAIIKYTTEIDARKTVGEVNGILASNGAKAVLVEYDQGRPVALAFKLDTSRGEMGYRLPANPHAILRILERDRVDRRYRNLDQATRVAWRIIKDWVASQAALAESEMVEMEEIFLPYLLLSDKQTVFERWKGGYLLTSGKE